MIRIFHPPLYGSNPVRILAGIVLCLFATAIQAEKPFFATTDGRGVSMRTGSTRVRTLGQSFDIRFSSSYGNQTLYSHAIRTVASIHIRAETEDRLVAELVSPVSAYGDAEKAQYVLQLEIRRGSPCLFIRSGIRNLGDHPALLYYFWRIAPAQTDLYFLPDGAFKVSSKRLHKDRWVFLPRENAHGGLGLLFDADAENLFFQSNYPDNWRAAGWYLIRNLAGRGRSTPIPPGEMNRIDFVVFPAKDEDVVAATAESLYEKSTLPWTAPRP